jgi:aryl-alcohol dehydrogenase-like predicted oxidoreductase
MRMPPEVALETIAAAVQSGITVFDTARAYDDNESLVAHALRHADAVDTARIVTKGGMKPTEGRWIPDGRAKAIRADCEGSLAALDGLEIDLYLIHAPDPATPWKTSVRALARLVDEAS